VPAIYRSPCGYLSGCNSIWMQFYRMQWQANPANLNFMGSFESSRDRHDGDVVFLAEVFCHLGDARSGLVANLLGALKAYSSPLVLRASTRPSDRNVSRLPGVPGSPTVGYPRSGSAAGTEGEATSSGMLSRRMACLEHFHFYFVLAIAAKSASGCSRSYRSSYTESPACSRGTAVCGQCIFGGRGGSAHGRKQSSGLAE
jgi:hypothetical protein